MPKIPPMKKALAILVGIALLASFTGCKKEQPEATTAATEEKIELTYYRLFDGEDIFEPLIRQYESEHKNITINYKKFTDADKYLNLIINELAEGQGPDLFSMQNTWFVQHRKKLSPVPSDLISVDDFKNVFVNIASKDLILPDDSGVNQIYGLPLYIDTLALYYNQDQFEDAVPSRGKPASTWSELQEDVFKLTKADNSFERFERAGIAMGRSDNVLRTVDILYLLMIQFGAHFYDSKYSEATFAENQGASTDGIENPGVDALQFYSSFALPSSKYYTWNASLSKADSDEKELKTFARGKVAMIIGYSHMYQQILDQIQQLEKKGEKTISANSVKIAPIPQLEDPKTSTEKRDTYGSYFAETVSRTSEHSKEAWEFLSFLVSKENLQYYNEQTHRPTSRRDMIDDQKDDPIYGVFADQIGFAESLPMADDEAYDEIFKKVIDAVLATKDAKEVLMVAQEEISALIPKGGLFPITILPTEGNTN